MAEIDKVTYRKVECSFSMDCDEGVRVFREYYSPNCIGVVTRKIQQVSFIPALSVDEFDAANKLADDIISHFEMVTGDYLKKINP